jgi:putative tryptophan/tyrosine transport system substrate-binding protein
MKRRDVLVGLLLTAVCRMDAREHGKPNRVAFVAPVQSADRSETRDFGPLFQELRRLGYAEGQNLIVDRYFGEGRVERYGELARDVVRLKPDLVFAITTAIAQNLKAATATIPLVGIVVDPIGFGLVDNLARPGQNFTGVSVDAGIEIWGKRLELLKEVNPKLSRMGVLMNKVNWEASYGRALRNAAEPPGCSLLAPLPKGPLGEAEYRQLLAAMVHDGTEAIVVAESAENVTNRRVIGDLVTTYRLPAIFPLRLFAASGGVMSYGVDFADLLHHAAAQVDKILKGVNPGEIPIYQATKFELVINLKTAKVLGVTVPPSIVALADEVID